MMKYLSSPKIVPITRESIRNDFENHLSKNRDQPGTNSISLERNGMDEYCCVFTRQAFHVYMQQRIIRLDKNLQIERGRITAITDYMLQKISENKAAKQNNTQQTGEQNV